MAGTDSGNGEYAKEDYIRAAGMWRLQLGYKQDNHQL